MNQANRAIQVIRKISEDQGNSMLYIVFIIGPDLYFNVLNLSLKTALGEEGKSSLVIKSKISFCLDPKTVFCLLSRVGFFCCFFSNKQVAFPAKEMLGCYRDCSSSGAISFPIKSKTFNLC